MADTKISALTDGAPAVSTDIIPVARAGANRRVTVGDIATAVGFKGSFASTAALQAAYPAASNELATAIVNAGTPARNYYMRVDQGIWKLAPQFVSSPVTSTRNSANDATDDDEADGCVFTVPAGLLVVGSFLELQALITNTNSANTKNWRLKVNTQYVVDDTATTATARSWMVRLYIESLTNIIFLNSTASTGAATIQDRTISDVSTNALEVKITTRWNTQPISGETIVIRRANLYVIG